VTVAEAPEGLLGHDLHLARLDEGTDLATVVAWTDFVDQLRHPAPTTFLGGADEIAPGATGYFRVTLTPGRYALVSEEYGPAGIAHEFEVQ